MSQEEVIAWPEAHPGWHATDAIARGMGVLQNNANYFLRKAYIKGNVQRREGGHHRRWEWSI